MGKITKKKIVAKVRITTENTIKDYFNDPYFIKKREIGAAFLKKVGLPETFTKRQSK